MAEKNNWLRDLLGFGIITVAAIAVLQSIGKAVKKYNCPVCKADINENESPCHNCGSYLEWPNKTEKDVETTG